MANFGAKRFGLNLINLKGRWIGKIWESCRRGDNRKWLKTDPKPNLLTITTGPPPYNYYYSVGRYLRYQICTCVDVPDVFLSFEFQKGRSKMWELWWIEISLLLLKRHIAYATACCHRTSRGQIIRLSVDAIVTKLLKECLHASMFVTDRSSYSSVDDRLSIVPQQDVGLGSNLQVYLWSTAVVEKRPDTNIECNRQSYTVSSMYIQDRRFINFSLHCIFEVLFVRKWCIGLRLLLMTNRKLHTRFRTAITHSIAQNAWPWMALNGCFTLNSVLRRYMYSSEAWFSELGYS